MLVPRLPWERHPRRSLSVVARVWGSHAGAWEPSIIRTMPIVPMLPRGNVARVAPCRWLRSAWGLPRRSVEPSIILPCRSFPCSRVGTLPASLPVDGCALPGAPTQERGSHQTSAPCRSFPCSRVGTLPASLPVAGCAVPGAPVPPAEMLLIAQSAPFVFAFGRNDIVRPKRDRHARRPLHRHSS